MLCTTILRAAAPVLSRNAPRAVAAIAPTVLRASSAAFPRGSPARQSFTRRIGAVRMYSAGGPLAQHEVTSRIMNILSRFDKVQDASKITEKSHFANDLGLDSLDTVEVVMAIEEEFGIEIPDKDADSIHSIPLAVEYIMNQPDAH